MLVRGDSGPGANEHSLMVFDPNGQRYSGQSLSQCYITTEKDKKRAYNERVTPLVFSCYGGMSSECGHFIKRLCSLLVEKRDENLSLTTSWVRRKIYFALLRSCLMCVRGTRHRYYKYKFSDIDVECETKEIWVEPM